MRLNDPPRSLAFVKQSEMNTREVTRRQLLSSVGLAAGASLLAGCGDDLEGAPPSEKAAPSETAGACQRALERNKGWKYRRLDPATVAAEAYRLVPHGGCMYGLFASVMAAMGQLQGEPYLSFPVHMMKYGEGGVGQEGCCTGNAEGPVGVPIRFSFRQHLCRFNVECQVFSFHVDHFRHVKRQAFASFLRLVHEQPAATVGP